MTQDSISYRHDSKLPVWYKTVSYLCNCDAQCGTGQYQLPIYLCGTGQ